VLPDGTLFGEGVKTRLKRAGRDCPPAPLHSPTGRAWQAGAAGRERFNSANAECLTNMIVFDDSRQQISNSLLQVVPQHKDRVVVRYDSTQSSTFLCLPGCSPLGPIAASGPPPGPGGDGNSPSRTTSPLMESPVGTELLPGAREENKPGNLRFQHVRALALLSPAPEAGVSLALFTRLNRGAPGTNSVASA
jgi:hypothetical protein